MALPVIVTLIGAVIGNILGYTALKKVCAGMYYGSYSLPTYVTAWNADAFWMTTVVPVLIMLVVNYGILRLQAEAFTVEIPEKRSFWKQAEKSSPAKSEAWNLPSVPTSCDLPEYE